MKRQKPPSSAPPLSFRDSLRKSVPSPSAKPPAKPSPPARGERENIASTRGPAPENVAKATRDRLDKRVLSSSPLPDEAEKALPTDYIRGARPLAPRVERVPPPTRSAPPSERPAGRAPGDTSPIFEMRSDESSIEGARVGFAQRLRDLARGLLPVFDTLDLHGFTAEKAEKAVRAFCSSARGTVPRTVLIVHGKGRHSDGGRSVLRDEIALWLSSAPVARDVLCFATARSKHGGGGAMYVLLAARSGAAPRGDAGPSSKR